MESKIRFIPTCVGNIQYGIEDLRLKIGDYRVGIGPLRLAPIAYEIDGRDAMMGGYNAKTPCVHLPLLDAKLIQRYRQPLRRRGVICLSARCQVPGIRGRGVGR